MPRAFTFPGHPRFKRIEFGGVIETTLAVSVVGKKSVSLPISSRVNLSALGSLTAALKSINDSEDRLIRERAGEEAWKKHEKQRVAFLNDRAFNNLVCIQDQDGGRKPFFNLWSFSRADYDSRKFTAFVRETLRLCDLEMQVHRGRSPGFQSVEQEELDRIVELIKKDKSDSQIVRAAFPGRLTHEQVLSRKAVVRRMRKHVVARVPLTIRLSRKKVSPAPVGK